MTPVSNNPFSLNDLPLEVHTTIVLDYDLSRDDPQLYLQAVEEMFNISERGEPLPEYIFLGGRRIDTHKSMTSDWCLINLKCNDVFRSNAYSEEQKINLLRRLMNLAEQNHYLSRMRYDLVDNNWYGLGIACLSAGLNTTDSRELFSFLSNLFEEEIPLSTSIFFRKGVILVPEDTTVCYPFAKIEIMLQQALKDPTLSAEEKGRLTRKIDLFFQAREREFQKQPDLKREEWFYFFGFEELPSSEIEKARLLSLISSEFVKRDWDMSTLPLVNVEVRENGSELRHSIDLHFAYFEKMVYFNPIYQGSADYQESNSACFQLELPEGITISQFALLQRERIDVRQISVTDLIAIQVLKDYLGTSKPKIEEMYRDAVDIHDFLEIYFHLKPLENSKHFLYNLVYNFCYDFFENHGLEVERLKEEIRHHASEFPEEVVKELLEECTAIISSYFLR